ncbi:MAG: bis(5'-nucleosyl)-tetraphosphatase (symmetrical) YqeK [Trueperaceae bacterium]|nr:bis(5'-nucleosyl)-tetraphosphatase (symmetrical) YqeK [Trueperaceae bacterium]
MQGEGPTSLFSRSGPCGRRSIAPYCERVRSTVTAPRFEHIQRVAELAESIARANRFDERELRATCLAAVLHDVARDLPSDRMFTLAPPDCDLERTNPLSLHGRAGRSIARAWGVTDERVLDAIEGHVFGVRYGDRVGMAVYVADISEPGRGVNADIREQAMHDLTRAYRRAVEAKVRYLRRCGKDVHPRTLKVHDEISHAT